MNSFSERFGYKKASDIIQVDSMSDELRVSLWNVLHDVYWSRAGYFDDEDDVTQKFNILSHLLWVDYFKRPIDKRPRYLSAILEEIRGYFFTCPWNNVYDFIEFVASTTVYRTPELPDLLNTILEREQSGYRLVDGHFIAITSGEEIQILDDTVSDSDYPAVSEHMTQALKLFAARDNPDFRNSMKESISAVEAMARIVSENDRATLGEALTAIEKNGQLHPALKEGFTKLYGYASDADGIRHAMSDKPNVDEADARYFLVSCSAFVNYLKMQIP